VTMAAIVRAGEPASKVAPAIREFCAAVGSLIELITQARHRRPPQRSLPPEEESSGELQVVPLPRARTPRAARERLMSPSIIRVTQMVHIWPGWF